MVPVVIGLSIEQLNTFFDSLIAWGFSQPATGPAVIPWLPGSVEYPLEGGTASALYFSQRIYQFPLGVFGVALSTVIFPLLSQHAGTGRLDRLRDDFMFGLRLVFYIGIPASIGLMVLAEPLTVLLFRRGEFTAENVHQTANMTWAYATGVWAYCGVLILQRGYYAVGDRMTPLRIGLCGIAIDLTLNLTLIWPMGGFGLALSTALSAVIQFGLVAWLVQERVGKLDWLNLGRAAALASIASAAMAAACYVSLRLIPESGSFGARLAAVVLPFGVALIVYFGTARVLGMSELWLLFRRDRKV
jgi:putative peptidoglycan lipid II flippase